MAMRPAPMEIPEAEAKRLQGCVVAHLDMDCFYVQVEQQLNPSLKGKPVGVLQYTKDGAIIALSYEAKRAGVKRGMSAKEAQARCKGIEFARVAEKHGKANLTKYRKASQKVFDILIANPTRVVERISIDEAYVDITAEVDDYIAAHPTIRDLPRNTMCWGAGEGARPTVDAGIGRGHFFRHGENTGAGTGGSNDGSSRQPANAAHAGGGNRGMHPPASRNAVPIPEATWTPTGNAVFSTTGSGGTPAAARINRPVPFDPERGRAAAAAAAAAGTTPPPPVSTAVSPAAPGCGAGSFSSTPTAAEPPAPTPVPGVQQQPALAGAATVAVPALMGPAAGGGGGGDAADGTPSAPPPAAVCVADWNTTERRMAAAAWVMAAIREEVTATLGFTCSVGIATNKIIAKLSTGFNKPDGQTVVLPRVVPELWEQTPTKNVRSLGGKEGERLRDSLGILHVADLKRYSIRELASCVGAKRAEWLHYLAWGFCKDVVASSERVKSIGCSKTFPQGLGSYRVICNWIAELAKEIAERTSEDVERYDRHPTCLVLGCTLRGKRGGISKRKSYPAHPPVSLEPAFIHAEAISLYDALSRPGPVTSLSLGFSNMVDHGPKRTTRRRDNPCLKLWAAKPKDAGVGVGGASKDETPGRVESPTEVGSSGGTAARAQRKAVAATTEWDEAAEAAGVCADDGEGSEALLFPTSDEEPAGGGGDEDGEGMCAGGNPGARPTEPFDVEELSSLGSGDGDGVDPGGAAGDGDAASSDSDVCIMSCSSAPPSGHTPTPRRGAVAGGTPPVRQGGGAANAGAPRRRGRPPKNPLPAAVPVVIKEEHPCFRLWRKSSGGGTPAARAPDDARTEGADALHAPPDDVEILSQPAAPPPPKRRRLVRAADKGAAAAAAGRDAEVIDLC